MGRDSTPATAAAAMDSNGGGGDGSLGETGPAASKKRKQLSFSPGQ